MSTANIELDMLNCTAMLMMHCWNERVQRSTAEQEASLWCLREMFPLGKGYQQMSNNSTALINI